MKKFTCILIASLFSTIGLMGQGKISGIVINEGLPVEFVAVGIIEVSTSLTDSKGSFEITNIPFGTHEVTLNHVAFKDTTFFIILSTYLLISIEELK